MKLKKRLVIIIITNTLLLLEFNNLAGRVFDARLAQADLVTKTDFDTRLQSLNKKNNSKKTKHLLVETELKKIRKG